MKLKKITPVLAIAILLPISNAVVATYSGEETGQGPETEFKIGIAADQELKIRMDVQNQSGLNISQPENTTFDPDSAEKVVQRNGETLPLEEYKIRVESVEPTEDEYNLPIGIRAISTSGDDNQPRIVQERQYNFEYITEESEEFFEGDLIGEDPSGEKPAESQKDEGNSSEKDSENTKTEEEETVDKEENEKGVSPILVLGIILVFGYTIYEAIT